MEDAQAPIRPTTSDRRIRPSTLTLAAAFDLRAFGGVGKSVRACETQPEFRISLKIPTFSTFDPSQDFIK